MIWTTEASVGKVKGTSVQEPELVGEPEPLMTVPSPPPSTTHPTMSQDLTSDSSVDPPESGTQQAMQDRPTIESIDSPFIVNGRDTVPSPPPEGAGESDDEQTIDDC